MLPQASDEVMAAGELVTRWTIRVALGLFVAALALRIAGRKPAARDGWARLAWTIGCACYLAHVVAAFHFFHHWSHAAAWEETARQTDEVFGWRWGGGLLFNHAFTLCWTADCAWWWLSPRSYRHRPRRLSFAVIAFLAFMAFNATVIFESGPTRWLGLAATVGLTGLWLSSRKSRSIPG